MAQLAIKNDRQMERKIISISVRRQITIPQKYFDVLGFDNEAECILQDGYLLIRPIQEMGGGEFSEQILTNLIAQGYNGEELLKRFKDESKQIRPAIQKMVDAADRFAKSGEGKLSIDDLFGPEV